MSVSQSPALNRIPQVVLADDHPMIRKTVTTILTPHFEVVAAVSDGKAALDAAARENPDLVLLDINMPELSGFQAARELKRKQPHAKVVFLTAHEDDDYISEALAVGARGYVVKQRLRSDLLSALQVAHTGNFFISPYAFVGHTNQAIIKSNVTSAAPATQEQKNVNSEHVMEFYSEDDQFINRMGEVAFTSLAEGKSIIVVLKRSHLMSVSKQLSWSGIDLMEAIKRRDYREFCLEFVAPILMPNGQLDAKRFTRFFDPLFAHTALNAQKKCTETIVLGNLASALLDLGYPHKSAVQAEELWNDLAQKYACVVHCGYPVARLANASNREALSRICWEHSRIIPIDQHPEAVRI